jgi:hypothetical protein
LKIKAVSSRQIINQQTLDVIIPSIGKDYLYDVLRFGKTNTFASKRNNCGKTQINKALPE